MSEKIEDPRFNCEVCGFHNVTLTPEGAFCTNCGVRYERQ